MKPLLLDLDGVIFDFVGGVSRLLNMKLPEKIHWGLGKTFNLPDDYIWNKIEENSPDFFANLDFMPDAEGILQLVKSSYPPDQVYIVTSAGLGTQAVVGKKEAIKRLPEQLHGRDIITRHKYLVDGLLLDDHDGNIDKHHDAGRFAIQVPRPWNRLAHKPTLEYLWGRFEWCSKARLMSPNNHIKAWE